MARLIVLGAAGFIGRAVRRELAAAEHEVICVDRLQGASSGGERWFQVDLLGAEANDVRSLADQFDPAALINCAGMVEGPLGQLARANVLLVASVIEALGTHSARLVHIGSAAEYGPSEHGRSVDEDATPRPVTAYAITKLAGTQLVANAALDGNADTVVLRLFNPLGPGMAAGSMPGRAASLIRAAHKSGEGSIRMGSLDAWRDFIDVRDAAAAIVAAALGPSAGVPILNVGTGRAVQARQVVEAIAEAAAWDGEIIEAPALGSPRSQGVSWQRADVSRIGAALGWAPRHGLAEAAASVLADAP